MVKQAELSERIEKCGKILSNDPNSQIFAALADAHRKNGNLDQAFAVCREGLKIHSQYGAAHVVMAKINLDRGQYDWAEAEAVQARELSGNSRVIELLLSEIFIYKGDFKAASALLKKLHDADPNNEHVTNLLAIARKIPREQRAMMGDQPTVVESEVQATQTITTSSSQRSSSHEPAIFQEDLASGILGVLFSDDEGLAVHVNCDPDIDAAEYSATMRQLEDQIQSGLSLDWMGKVTKVLVEAEELILYSSVVSGGSYLVIAEPTASLGILRMTMDNCLEKQQYERTS